MIKGNPAGKPDNQSGMVISSIGGEQYKSFYCREFHLRGITGCSLSGCGFITICGARSEE